MEFAEPRRLKISQEESITCATLKEQDRIILAALSAWAKRTSAITELVACTDIKLPL